MRHEMEGLLGKAARTHCGNFNPIVTIITLDFVPVVHAPSFQHANNNGICVLSIFQFREVGIPEYFGVEPGFVHRSKIRKYPWQMNGKSPEFPKFSNRRNP